MRNGTFAMIAGWVFLITYLCPPPVLFGGDVILFGTTEPRQGEVFPITVLSEKDLREVEILVGDEKNYLRCNGKKAEGLLGLDLSSPPGMKKLHFILRGSEWQKEIVKSITLIPAHFPTQHINGIEESYVYPGKEALKRIKRDTDILSAIWKSSSKEVYWEGAFILPFAGFYGENFGKKRIINGEPRSPHTGVDSHAPRGTPIRAINSGMVKLVEDLYFAGISVIIDHGGGLFSMYFHLQDAIVESSDFLRKGDVIGHVGDSGRATGPHLHLGIRFVNQRVDPMDLFR